MVFKKYAVEDNCWANLASSIDANTTRIRIKNARNLPQSGERIATLAKKQGDEIIKMEKVLVLRREIDLLIVQRGFQSTAQAWEENDVINLYITAEIIRDLQNCLSAIDESNLVHKSGDEEIGGNKKFSSDIEAVGTDGEYWRGSSFTSKKSKTSPEMWKMGGRSDYDNGLLFEFTDGGYYNNFLLRRKGGLQFSYFTDNPGDKRFFKIGTRSDFSGIAHDSEGHIIQVLWGDLCGNPEGNGHDGGRGLEFGTHGDPYLRMKGENVEIGNKSLLVNGQNWTGEWQTYTPTITTGSGNLGEYRIRNGRYKVVGKTVFCAIYLDFKRGEATGGIDISLPTNSKNHTETPVPIIVGGHGMLYKDTKAKGAIKTGGKLRILKGIVSGVSIQELSPHSESHFVICGEFMYEMP